MEVKNKYINQLLNNISKEHKEKALNNFVANYTAGKISLPVSYNQYLNLKDIQSRIEALGLDKDEMWFLLLFIKDLAECIFDFEINNIGVKEKLNAIIEMIKAPDVSISEIEKNNLLIAIRNTLYMKDSIIKMIIAFLSKYLDTRDKMKGKCDSLNYCNKILYMKALLEEVFGLKEIGEAKVRKLRDNNKDEIISSFTKIYQVSNISKIGQ